MSANGHNPSADQSGGGDGERGLVGDAFQMLKGFGKGQQSHGGQEQGGNAKPDKVSGFLDKLQDSVTNLGNEFAEKLGTAIDPHGYAQYGLATEERTEEEVSADGRHRFGSFAPTREQNDVKWYVDGCNYFHAVSRALEDAKEYIWILDWWLSPELYLRRPPAKNEQYRLDRMLQAAAQRGVKVNIIVYKEVSQALSLNSSHTKHALESLHPNIAVFRHPDHFPDREELKESITASLQNFVLNAAGVSKLDSDAVKGLYGVKDDVILYWAHHEKMCLIDGRIAFMGGLDLCYGRWDTNQHFIADVHPTDLGQNMYPGQDYNNARVLDFQNVAEWENNQLDRKTTPRMGWSDVSVSLHGIVVEDLRRHFVERWNFIYDDKYSDHKHERYYKLALYGPSPSVPQLQQSSASEQQPPQQPPQQSSQQSPEQPPQQPPQQPYQQPPQYQQPQPVHPYHPDGSPNTQYYDTRGVPSQAPPQQGEYPPQERGIESGEEGDGERKINKDKLNGLRGQLAGQIHQYQDRFTNTIHHYRGQPGHQRPRGPMTCQIVRSCSKWSHGVETEHSIADAYASIIRDSKHFIYMENQFFITATSDEQKPVQNKVGAAIVERILRAAREGQKFKIMVIIPSVPAFPGDLRDESTLGTRAILEYQYNSINRGGHSIMELVAKEGYNPMDYIRFYNLRNYDRLNVSGALLQAQEGSGVDYEEARKAHEASVSGIYNYGPHGAQSAFDTTAAFQKAASQAAGDKESSFGRWDSVSECYMLGGEDIRNVPWEGPPEAEIDAFVSEELYVHTKVLIADDRVVICGSANMNDRSQLGTHDSEIAIIVQDHTPIPSTMNGQPWTASRFASSLRRELFRKHLGLLPPQDYQRLNINAEPISVAAANHYDFESPESRVVADPLADVFQNLWNSRARTNTEVFRKVFHPVPDDTVRTWDAYKEFFEYFFRKANQDAQGKETLLPPRYEWGHVVRDGFAEGPEGVKQVKELLSQVKGTLVEMPLMFLIEEDVAKQGLALNELTEPIYT